MDTRCRVELLGELRVVQGERVITRFRTRQTGALLAYLAYHLGRHLAREVVIEAIWPEAEAKTGRNNLSIALNSLRSQLEPPGVSAGAILLSDRFSVGLNPSAIVTDVADYLSALQAAEKASEDAERNGALRQAIERYHGELLPGFYDEWVLQERHRLQTLYEQAEEGLNRNAPALPASAVLPAVAVSPLPAPQPGPHVHLPLQFTRFFGREEELGVLSRWCGANAQDPTTHLITLTGPGGTGKTRLAIEAASRLAQTFTGGVWFVPLQDFADPRLIPGAVLDALRLPRYPQAEPLHQAVAFLNGCASATLLVLDNMEQLLEGERRKAEDGASVVRALLDRCPSLTCLVTSRQNLSLEGEHELPVLPLPVPGSVEEAGPSTPERPSPRSPEELMQFASVQLFVDRAQSSRPDFRVTASNASAIAQLCERLEGIPLALVLAAGRAQVMTPKQMLSELEHRFDLLVSRKRDATERHRTLWLATEWSYRLLSPELRRFFARLSVFRGGWTRDAAAAVCEEPEALDYLEKLRECSLIAAEDSGGEMRFRMLETFREFGDQKLRAGDRAEHTQQKHCEWFLSLAEAAEMQLTGPEQVSWFERLERDHDNFRSALAWCGQREQEAETGLRMAGALFRFWMVRGYFIEGRGYLTRTLERAERETPTEFHAKALNGIGAFMAMQGDMERAKYLFRKSLAIRKRLGDKIQIANALNSLGMMEQENDLYDYSSARELYEESLSLFKELGDERGMAFSLSRLANIAYSHGNYEKARSLYTEGLVLRRQSGDAYGIAMSLSALGNVARDLGRYWEAKTLNEESLAIKRTLGDRWGIAESLNTLGIVARNTGDYAAARTLHEESLSLFREMVDKGCTANSLTMLGRAIFCQGNHAGARKLYEEGLALRAELGDKRRVAESLEVIAEMLLSEEQALQAVQIWGAADSLREYTKSAVVPAERDHYVRMIARARSVLGEASFDSAWKAGRALSMERAIASVVEKP